MMEKAKLVVEKEVSLDEITQIIVPKIKEKFVGKKSKVKSIKKEINQNIFNMIGERRPIIEEVIKKTGFFTKLFLKLNWIPKSSQYFFFYHLLFPTIQTRNKNNSVSYVIDDQTVYRLTIYLVSGEIRIRLKYNYRGVLEKISYRVVNQNKEEEIIYEPEDDIDI